MRSENEPEGTSPCESDQAYVLAKSAMAASVDVSCMVWCGVVWWD